MPTTRNRPPRSTSSPTAARLAEFTAFCSELRTEDGRPFVLHPFQQEIVELYFAGVREIAVILPKKNGKSTLIAALNLYHLVSTPNAEAIVVAASREQADIVLRQGRMFVRQSPELSRMLEIQQRTIRVKGEEGRIRILAADADTLDGALPTLSTVDELHRAKSADAYGVLRNGLGPRNGQQVTISTAGSRADSPLGRIRASAHTMTSFRRVGMRNTARSPDGKFAFLEYCLDPDDDTDDLEVVKQAHPAPWQTIEKLDELRNSAETRKTPWEWLRFFCGIWTEGEEPWIEPPVWDGLADGGLELTPGEQVWADVRVMFKRAAIVIGAPRDGRLAVVAEIIDPASYPVVEQALRDLVERYDVQQITHGARGFARSAELLTEEGLPMVEFPSTPGRLSEAAGTLYRLLQGKTLRHAADPDLRAQVMAGKARKDERGWRFVESETHAPIEALISLAVVAHTVGDGAKREPMMAWA